MDDHSKPFTSRNRERRVKIAAWLAALGIFCVLQSWSVLGDAFREAEEDYADAEKRVTRWFERAQNAEQRHDRQHYRGDPGCDCP